jgi:hypothetical protein
VVIRRIEDNYILTGISNPYHFGLSGMERPGSTECEGRDHYMNGIIPVAIVHWDETSMTLSFYRQNRDRILVKICGIVDRIAELAEKAFPIAAENFAGRCAIQVAYDQCRRYPR